MISSRALCLLLMLCVVVPAAEAKDLRKRFAAGTETQMSLSAGGQGLPSNLSFKYTFPAKEKVVIMQLQALVGLDVAATETRSLTGGLRFTYTVVAEDNCNVFLGLGGAVLQTVPVDTLVTTLRAQPLAGVEFFFYGLENLGFTTSIGLNIDFADSIDVSLAGTTFGSVGVHYYFW